MIITVFATLWLLLVLAMTGSKWGIFNGEKTQIAKDAHWTDKGNEYTTGIERDSRGWTTGIPEEEDFVSRLTGELWG